MTKERFLNSLAKKLSRLPKREIEECLAFYGEMIDDRIEEGLSEEDAVSAVGDIKKIAAEKLGEEISENLAERAKGEKRKIEGGKLALIIAGSPLWISLAAAAFAVVISLYASVWSVIASLWAVFAALAVCAPAGLILGVVFFFIKKGFQGAISISCALVSFALAIFSFKACLWLTKKCAILSKAIFIRIIRCISGKGI
jgi:uncharacterized membrane protein